MTKEEIENLKSGDRIFNVLTLEMYELLERRLMSTSIWKAHVILDYNNNIGRIVTIDFTPYYNHISPFILLPKEETNMKIECKKIEKKEITYPCFKKCLGASPEMIVLFFNETSGVVVTGKSLGTYSNNRESKNYSEPLKNYSVTFSTEE